jgi:hypothetical protein
MNLGHKCHFGRRVIPPLTALLVCLASAARGDVKYSTEGSEGNEVTVIKMNVTPAAEPVPALKYRLIARDIELKAGNSVTYYYRAFVNLPRDMERLRREYDEDTELGRWYATGLEATPIADLPLEKVHKASELTDRLIENYLAEATQRRDCDWQLGVEEIRGGEVFAFLLPEFQESRELTRLLTLRTRLAIAERQYDDAIDTMRINLRLARDVGSVPFLVCGLIGLAEASYSNGTLIELMAQPDAPNLYWALTELPQPLVDLRPAARFEVGLGPRVFPFIHHAETTDHSRDEWNRLYVQSLRDLSAFGGNGPPVRNDIGAGLVATGLALVGYPHAKRQLIAQGMDAARVEQMAVGQVVAIYSERNYQIYADDFEKAWYVPFWEMYERVKSVEKRLNRADPFGHDDTRDVLPIVSLLLPAMNAARATQVRLERDVAALRVIEALRMYAASHAGGLPESLDEVTEVPVPLNPATGKPFTYRLDNQTAILELPASEGFPGHGRRFEIQIAQKDKSTDDADGRR